MSENKNGNGKKHGGLVALIAGTNGGHQQIDIGDYVIRQGDHDIGRVFVEYDTRFSPPDPNKTVEHWCLSDDYVQPSANNDDVSVRFLRSGTPYASAGDFLQYVRNQRSVRYIKAVCEEKAP